MKSTCQPIERRLRRNVVTVARRPSRMRRALLLMARSARAANSCCYVTVPSAFSLLAGRKAEKMPYFIFCRQWAPNVSIKMDAIIFGLIFLSLGLWRLCVVPSNDSNTLKGGKGMRHISYLLPLELPTPTASFFFCSVA